MNAVEQIYAHPPVAQKPLTIVLDLPFPPSVNHIWRRAGRRVYRAAKYMRWLDAADVMVMAAKQYPRRKIVSHFTAEILLNEDAGYGDADNRIKAILDWCQSRDVIFDDKDCRELTVKWAAHESAPQGARITLRGVS